ncbi:hypothetical protein [Variovorax sp. LG9.2]|uniref:hypothetical protein n=1 Tax=Variovorax sp. LG9.2 TaxID=3048626 RepID=UPI002B22E82E|nr:hypothetical protein [Variovorax sp. LG9.2]MEB0057737.1 hypothetical protein [Variovorax sp. LG9.2]
MHETPVGFAGQPVGTLDSVMVTAVIEPAVAVCAAGDAGLVLGLVNEMFSEPGDAPFNVKPNAVVPEPLVVVFLTLTIGSAALVMVQLAIPVSPVMENDPLPEGLAVAVPPPPVHTACWKA